MTNIILTDNFTNEAICNQNIITESDSNCQQLDNIFLDDFQSVYGNFTLCPLVYPDGYFY